MLPNEPEVIDARLAWPDSQIALQGGVVERFAERATCGWYGTSLHDELGAFCLIDPDSQFAHLIGDRLKLSSGGGVKWRSIYVYAFGTTDLASGWDLAVPRRAFIALGLPTKDTLSVTVEVVAG